MLHPDDHPDEGTIHAWLDGALSADEARAVEEHVARCTRCAEAVAEARGLIAAASGILAKLDAVPAGVVPRPAAAPPRDAATATRVVPIDTARRAPGRAPWWSSSSLRVAAGLLIVATGTLVVVREQARSPERAESAVQFSVDRSSTTPTAATVAEQAAVAPQAPAVGLQKQRIAATESSPTPLSATASGALPVQPRAAVPLAARVAPPEMRADLAAPPAPPPAPATGSATPGRAGVVAAVGGGAASPERSAPTAQSLAARDARAVDASANVADVAIESRKAAKMVDEASTSPARRRAEAVVGAAAAPSAIPSPSAIPTPSVPPSALGARGPGCYVLQPARWTPAEPRLVVPQRLVLDTTAEASLRDPSHGSVFAARAIGPAAVTWRRAYWVPLAGDSVRVLWSDGVTVVELRARLVGDTLRGQAVASSDGVRPAMQRGALTGTRATCPAP